MRRTFLAAASLLLSVGQTFAAADIAQVMAGDPNGRNVTFSFDKSKGAKTSELRIETHLVGNPGAKLSIWVDSSKTPLFSRILTDEDCRYGDTGSQCKILVEGGSKEYRAFVQSFKRGSKAHVEVQNANVMQMQDDLSLKGFTRQYGR